MSSVVTQSFSQVDRAGGQTGSYAAAVLVAAAVCPHPPLIVPEVAAGAAHELDASPTAVAIVGRAGTSGRLTGTGGTLAPYGVPVRTGTGAPTLPLAHTIGAWLLDRARYVGPRVHWGVTDETNYDDVAREVTATGDRLGLLVMGDGTARRTEKAPGHLDPRAERYDAEVADAFRAGPDAVRALDGPLARDLLADGWPAWQVLARVDADVTLQRDVLYVDAPYGVGYFVVSWSPS